MSSPSAGYTTVSLREGVYFTNMQAICVFLVLAARGQSTN